MVIFFNLQCVVPKNHPCWMESAIKLLNMCDEVSKEMADNLSSTCIKGTCTVHTVSEYYNMIICSLANVCIFYRENVSTYTLYFQIQCSSQHKIINNSIF